MTMGSMSPIALSGTKRLVAMASTLCSKVLEDRTPKAAREYIGLIAELVPAIYTPRQGELETALDLVEKDLLEAELGPKQAILNYVFWIAIAKQYGLADRVSLYNHEIAELNGSGRG